MKRLIFLILLLIPLLITATASAFTPFGPTNLSSLKYEDFKSKGDGYSFTLVNNSQRSFSGFYVVVYGMDINYNTIYR